MSGSGRILIYGANGYTGRLIAERAVAEGDAPILAGRREAAVRPLAERLDLPWRAFGLDDPAKVAEALADVDVVIHCAGPFSATARPMVDGCLRSKTHYLDITGELAVFEDVLSDDSAARRAGVVLLPGAGFDVVPSDCLAASLAAALLGAVELELAFTNEGGGMSPGTTKTTLEGMPRGGCVRRDGALVAVPTAHRARQVPFDHRTQWAVAIPWGDVSTAWYSTKIPNITVYLGMPRRVIALMKLSAPFAPLLGLGPIQRALSRAVDRFVQGPSPEARAAARVHLWGRAADAAGHAVTGTLVTPEGYELTAEAALRCAERILAGDVAPGAWTPSRAFGPSFVTTLSGVTLRVPAPASAG